MVGTSNESVPEMAIDMYEDLKKKTYSGKMIQGYPRYPMISDLAEE